MENVTRISEGVWKVRFKYTDPLTGHQKRYQKTVHGSLDDAKRHRDEARISTRQGSHQLSRLDLRFGAHVESFLRSRALRKGMAQATLERDVVALDHHILPTCGEWLMDRITKADLEDLQDAWSRKERPGGGRYKPGTINTWAKTLRLYCAHAWERAGLGESPADGLEDVFDRTEKKGRALTGAELRDLASAIEEHYPQHYALFLVGATTGARISEVLALEWRDIDGDVIRFRRHSNDGEIHQGTKTGKEVRAVLLPEVAEVLAEHRQQVAKDQGVTALIFPSVTGGYRGRSATHKWLSRACELAKVDPISFHDLRRTFNSMLLESGANHVLVQALTGHSTDRMTVHYAHVSDDARRAVVVPISEALRGSRKGSRVGGAAE